MSVDTTGKAAGGRARAASLTPEQRSAIARKAASTRWTAPKAAAPEDSKPQIPPSAPIPMALDAGKPPERNDEGRDPTLYNRLFNTPDGQKVLDDLAARFYYVKTYVPGGLEAQRESEARSCRRDVLHYIIRRTSMAAE